MTSIFLNSHFLSFRSDSNIPKPCLPSRHRNKCHYHISAVGHSYSSYISAQFPVFSFRTLHSPRSSISTTMPEDEGTIPIINYEDVMEKDWSFLETDDMFSKVHKQNTDRIISAGGIEETSKVLVSIGSEGFMDQLVYSSPCQKLLLVHDSLFVLACIKEKYDEVNCWQGELINVPEKWAPLDVVFLYLLPALPYELSEVLDSLSKLCLPGARIIISYPLGRKVLEEQQGQYPGIIISSLPDKLKLQNVAADHAFDMVEFTDEPDFYLAVLKYKS